MPGGSWGTGFVPEWMPDWVLLSFTPLLGVPSVSQGAVFQRLFPPTTRQPVYLSEGQLPSFEACKFFLRVSSSLSGQASEHMLLLANFLSVRLQNRFLGMDEYFLAMLDGDLPFKLCLC